MTQQTSPPVYQLRYQLTREDIAAFELLPRELQGAEKIWLFGPVLALGAAVGLFEDELRTVLPWDPGTQWGQLATVACAVAIGYGISLALLTARTRHRIKSAIVPSSATAVDAYTDSVTVEEDGSSHALAWREAGVIQTPSHVFLSHGQRLAIIIPVRAFANPEVMKAFAEFATAQGRDPSDHDEQQNSSNTGTNNKETAP